jgi:hypothetical protein
MPTPGGVLVSLPALYKMNLKTDAKDRAELIDYCLAESVLGMGWGYYQGSGHVPTDFGEYYRNVTETWENTGPVKWFHDASLGSLVWFRDLQGRYYLALLAGHWRLIDGPKAQRMDLANVRDVHYAPVGSEAGVPGAVLRAYAVPRQRAFNQLHDDGAIAYSALLASELLGIAAPEIQFTTRDVLRSLLGPLDVEDLVAAYLQDTREYIALPARHARSTSVYEYALKHRGDGHIAVVQVKTGGATVPVETLVADGLEAKWFVYADTAQDLPAFVERISADELVAYMDSRPAALPPVTERWMRRAR